MLGTASMNTAAADNPKIKLETSYGNIILELYPEKAPLTVANFLEYVDSNFYSGTLFHRVIKNFMIQGGGYTKAYEKKPTRGAIKNEANNGLSNVRGTIAMARTSDPNSATSQFFINTVDNSRLDFQSAGDGGWGYCVFGKVIKGMQVVDDIASVPTGPDGPFSRDAPQGLVVIEKVTRINSSSKSKESKK